MPTSAERKRLLTIEEALPELPVKRTTAYEAAKRGQIPTVRIGGRLFVPRAQLDAFLDGTWKAAEQESGP